MKNTKKLGIVVAVLLSCAASAMAQLPPPIKGGPTNAPLDSWSFRDKTNWTSDLGYAPVSFGNLNSSILGNGASLVVDTNVSAWLQYNVVENDGTTNLTVDNGTITFWYAPNWNSTNGGIGQWAQLINVGQWTDDASFGYWGLSIDPAGTNIYFLSQDDSGNTYGLSAPISWTTNYFHFIALTYCNTNVALYLDGQLATNDANGLSILPPSSILAGGLYFGSDTNGAFQAHGLFNTIETYNYPLDSNTVHQIFNWQDTLYTINPFNIPYMNAAVSGGISNPSSSTNYYDAITGAGSLQQVGSVAGINSSNIWIANVVTVLTNGAENMTFTIQGGSNGVPYDVFANSVLSFGVTGIPWAWMGQGYQGGVYSLTNLPLGDCYLELGKPTDSDSDGLTDAYENLVSKSDPHNYNTSGDGLSDAWDVLLGLSAAFNQFAQPSTRSNYSYDPTDWLDGVSGIRTDTITLDNEGNVKTVSQ